jgi:hypothetical protein
MVEVPLRPGHAVLLHLGQDPLAQAHDSGQAFRDDKRHAFADAGFQQLGNLPVLERLDLPEQFLGRLRLSAGEYVQRDQLARSGFPRGVRSDAVVSQQLYRLIEWTKGHVSPPQPPDSHRMMTPATLWFNSPERQRQIVKFNSYG